MLGIKPGVEHGNHESDPVVSTENLLLRDYAISGNDSANVNVRLENRVAIRTFDGVNKLDQTKCSCIEARRRAGAVFKTGEAADVMAQLLCIRR